MPDTTNGFTYPAATDPVAQGAAAIQALAEDIDRKFGFGIALPGSPANGQEFVLTDSVTAPTWTIPLRYISALAKWLPIGKPSIRKFNAAAGGATTSTSYVNPASNPVEFTTPVTGVWDVFHRCFVDGVNYGRQSAYLQGLGATDANSTLVYSNAPASTSFGAFTEKLIPAQSLAAGTLVALQYRTNDPGVSVNTRERFLELRPVLLG